MVSNMKASAIALIVIEYDLNNGKIHHPTAYIGSPLTWALHSKTKFCKKRAIELEPAPVCSTPYSVKKIRINHFFEYNSYNLYQKAFSIMFVFRFVSHPSLDLAVLGREVCAHIMRASTKYDFGMPTTEMHFRVEDFLVKSMSHS